MCYTEHHSKFMLYAGISGASMDNRYVVKQDQCAAVFDSTLPPALVVDPGSLVRFEIGDTVFERLAAGEPLDDIGLNNLNTVTGPVYVLGAEPGDALRID